jgi:hypothetical protein
MRVAILGVYTEGPESSNDQDFVDRWSPWRLEAQSPVKLWKDAERALRKALRLYRVLNLYVYYGHDLPVERLLVW